MHRVEGRRGIPQARNAAVAVALERADFVAFIDDDEVPSPLWLAELLRLRAELARRRDDPAGAAADLGRALAVARAQGAVASTELVERDLEALRRRA